MNRADVWQDAPVIQYMQHQKLPQNATAVEVARIKRRAAGYTWRDNKLYRTPSTAEPKEVPPPEQRRQLVLDMHARTGHWGVRRTTALLSTRYWWAGIVGTTSAIVSECEHCQRVKATFNKQEAELHPLSIEGFCYRWSVDLAGPFQPVTQQGNTYVMIAIEHYTKHLEAITLPNNQSATVAFAFAHNVLARFGSCAEVVTDNGAEFQGDFHELLVSNLIDHRFTSALHPQAKGLAERAV
jgi:hypothetical protein